MYQSEIAEYGLASTASASAVLISRSRHHTDPNYKHIQSTHDALYLKDLLASFDFRQRASSPHEHADICTSP